MPYPRTHVEIGRNERGGHTLIVDGVDLSRKVLTEGFTVRFGGSPADPDLVTLTVAADTLDIDLPAAAVEAFRQDVSA